MRLFSALPLAPTCIERLMSHRLRWSSPGDGLRWSTPEQWHLTLCFFGDLDRDRARCVGERFGRLHGAAPTLVLEGLGLFAAKGILFASVQSSTALLDLHAEVAACGEVCGITSESRPFRPHITLARSKGRPGDSSLKRLAAGGPLSLGPEIRWRPAECLLLESVLRPQGAEYTVCSRVPLQP